MVMMYLSFGIAIASSVLYHIFQKAITPEANPVISLLVTYFVAFGLTLFLLLVFPLKSDIITSFRQLNWASIVLAVAIVGLEMGFLLAYRAGWDIGLAGVATNVAAAVLLVPAGLLVFQEKPTLVNLLGVAVCIIGLVMVNARSG
jgi:drug/metabolite transporter (DMT)-like permease